MEQIIQSFRAYLQGLGYSKSIVLMLPNCLAEFLTFTQKPVELIRPQDIRSYHTYLEERPNRRRSGGLSEQFIHHHIYSLKVFFSYQIELGVIEVNPISGLAFPSPTSRPRVVLSRQEIKVLYAATINLKERALMSLFYGCGLRRSEGEKLDMKDIQFRSGLLYVRQGKNKKRRAVPMSERVMKDLKNYALEERKQTSEAAYLLNRLGRRLSGEACNYWLKKICARTDIQEEVSLHCLRHSIATHLLESGLEIEYVRDFLGHKHLESTQVYTRIKTDQLWTLKDT